MKTHEKKPLSVDEVTDKIDYQSRVDVVALKNSIVSEANEYQRKLELGREVKRIVQELNVSTACLSKEFAEALEVFEKHYNWKYLKNTDRLRMLNA